MPLLLPPLLTISDAAFPECRAGFPEGDDTTEIAVEEEGEWKEGEVVPMPRWWWSCRIF
jgi:hypothetical protein